MVGLGNPGPAYAAHRHNIGYRVVDVLAARAATGFQTAPKLRAEVCQTRLAAGQLGGLGADADRVLLLKSRSYMNDSGQAVGKAATFYQLPPTQLVVVHDELDLDPGRIRLKFGGGDNGHNGLKSIRSVLGTGEFYRVRVGIGRPPGRQPTADWVLQGVPASQREDEAVDIERAADAVITLLSAGLNAAQNEFNS